MYILFIFPGFFWGVGAYQWCCGEIRHDVQLGVAFADDEHTAHPHRLVAVFLGERSPAQGIVYMYIYISI